MSSAAYERSAVARLYARALLELTETDGTTDEVLAELTGLAELVSRGDETLTFLESPLVKPESRTRLFEEVLRGKVQDVTVDTLQVMNRRERAGLVPELAQAFLAEVDALRAVDVARVVSAVPLSAEQGRSLAATIEKKTSRKVRLQEQVDPEILGGLIVQLRDFKYDHSVAREMRVLHDQLLDRASHEIVKSREDSAE